MTESSDATKVANWAEFKSRLADTALLSTVFIGLADVEWTPPLASRHDPLLIRRNVDRISEIADRALSLRKDIRDLEILAVKSAAEFSLFMRTSELERDIEIRRLLTPSRRLQSQGEIEAAALFGSETDLSLGFGKATSASGQALAEEVKISDLIEADIRRKHDIVRDHQIDYSKRFIESGNAHNYGERATRLLSILGREIADGLERALAVSTGLKTVYGWDTPPLPKSLNLANVDDFAVWTLDVRKQLSLFEERQDSFNITLPLVQPWLSAKSALVSEASFRKALTESGDGLIRIPFSLTSAHFFNQKVRLNAVGMSFGNAFGIVPSSGIDSIETADSFARLSALLKPPAQRLAGGQELIRQNLVLGSVGHYSAGEPVAKATGTSIENLDPVGSWELLIHPWLVWKDASERKIKDGIRNELIRDIKLWLSFTITSGA